ncbi:unnamed protein product [Pleuronectes platessa]|uniref:Uncharacterized protein n=1 Tax=Pleuronectes platessa TaxID=8262 RepID=A0A9N7VPS0_PLEPL|nr:unnamed protein product [Pleuronectes platessa]
MARLLVLVNSVVLLLFGSDVFLVGAKVLTTAEAPLLPALSTLGTFVLPLTLSIPLVQLIRIPSTSQSPSISLRALREQSVTHVFDPRFISPRAPQTWSLTRGSEGSASMSPSTRSTEAVVDCLLDNNRQESKKR